MERSLELSVRSQLATFLAGESTLDDFKSWLVAATWSLDRPLASTDSRIINEIKLALAEHSGGFGSDAELRETLFTLLDSTSVTAEMVG